MLRLFLTTVFWLIVEIIVIGGAKMSIRIRNSALFKGVEMSLEKLQLALQAALAKYAGDVFLYYGPVDRGGYDGLSSALESIGSNKQEKACLILITYGGDPNAAYRMARAMHHHYQNVEIMIPDACKSAGTLMCIGANKLIFGDRGELGPLDIQLSKPDEMFENMSGLDIIQALNMLQQQVLYSFRDYLVDIRGGCNIRTKTAAEIATKLASGFVSPIAQKIDPVTLGEHQRAMQIANDYGSRLHAMSDSMRPGALNELIAGYPAHGFVIDRKEAAHLFKNVAEPDDETIGLYNWARMFIGEREMQNQPVVAYLAKQDNNERANGDINEESNDGAVAQEATGDQEPAGNEGDHEGSGSEGSGDEQLVVGSDQAKGAA